MFVEKELFVIKEKDNYILYAPTALTAIFVTKNVIRNLQECSISGEFPEGSTRNFLIKNGILSDNPFPTQKTKINESFSPTSVTLFTTSDCNLRCIYCFASAGAIPKVMEFSVAKAAIDLIIDNSLIKEINKIEVSFHGGGEPLYGSSWARVREIISYTKSVTSAKSIEVSFSCATNGVLSKRQLIWAANTFNRINLSIDGPPDIQNFQRPIKTGAKSAKFVERTIEYFEKHGCNYGVRSTISRKSVNRLKEIVTYLHNVAPSSKIHLEPLFSCGRCVTTGIEAPDPDTFIKEFLKAQILAKKNGIEIYNSGASINRCSEHFCGATKDNFCVTPWGTVTSCYEVSLPTDPRGTFFFIGEFDQLKRSFVFNKKRLSKLQERCSSNNSECKDCFMKYACAGDCPAKSALKTGKLFGGFRCKENRILGASAIKNAIVPVDEIENRS